MRFYSSLWDPGFKISFSQSHPSYYASTVVTRDLFRLFVFKRFFFFFQNFQKSIIKSGSVAIKGQFTIQKATPEGPSRHGMLKGPWVQSVSRFFSFPLVLLSRGSWVLLKHRAESASGREAGTPLLRRPAPGGRWTAAAGPSFSGSVQFPWTGTCRGASGCRGRCCCCCWKEG